ncbi:two-component system, OmpR family, response regulator [Arboricoccus pini]|uniref:Two-component system, OmpR family, response regulator n=1 Tax=Arboricoccus pini TaxID=1963835 RepID=A0A212RN08_9PROT|nr:response regulator transcription factor [Arboricoccus pini]SNB73901.1 two-component system, OmpR family, response regulator [Arboricoccus pini]
MRILLIEDDTKTADFVRAGLEEAGHTIEWAQTGNDGLFLATTEAFDVLIVDRLLPALDGLTIVKMLRAGEVRTPVLFLSTLAGIDDRVSGLEAGGDDYLVKPFAFSELQARVNALSRRPSLVDVPSLLRAGHIEMDLARRQVRYRGRRIDLQPREFRLLEYLLRNADRVVTRTMLLEHVWDFSFDPKTSLVETHISRLRGKIDKDHGHELIETVRGAGYCLRAAL